MVDAGHLESMGFPLRRSRRDTDRRQAGVVRRVLGSRGLGGLAWESTVDLATIPRVARHEAEQAYLPCGDVFQI